MSAVRDTPLHDPRAGIAVTEGMPALERIEASAGARDARIVRRLVRASLALLSAWPVAARGQAVYSEALDAVVAALLDEEI
jgi:hypothetical protein